MVELSAKESNASRVAALGAHVANGTYRVMRAMLIDEPQPFWELLGGQASPR